MKIKPIVQYIMLIFPFSFAFVATFSLINFMISKKIKNVLFLAMVFLIYGFIILLVPLYINIFFNVQIDNSPFGYLFYYPINVIFSIIIINYQKNIFPN